MHFFKKPKASSSDESQGQGPGRWQSIRWIVTDSTTTTTEEKKGTVQKTSVGLHSKGVIPAISVGNTSALPAGSPSGGVRVGAAANTTETDVQAGGRGGGCFSPSESAWPFVAFCLENVGQGEHRSRKWLMNVVHGHENNQKLCSTSTWLHKHEVYW